MEVIRKSAFARAGLIGNPSDGYHGKTIAFSIRDYRADVALYEWPTIEIVATRSDLDQFDNVLSLQEHVTRHGYYGGTRLIKATIKQFVDYCVAHNHSLHNRNFAIRYGSNIPQQVGMAGSSAIIIATLRALMEFYGISIDKKIQPSFALDVERRELGIAGGLQDRVAQIYEGMVAMDFSINHHHLGFEYGSYESLSPALLPLVYLAFRPASSEPTEVFHNDLRARYDGGDKVVVDAMSRFAELTTVARAALIDHDYQLLHDTINANFDLRNSICTLNPKHTEMVSMARACGASAKYAGSGGTIVGTCNDQSQFEVLHKRLTSIGCTVIKPTLA